MNTAKRNSNCEIDILALTNALWGQKWAIILVTLAITFAALAYAFLTKPIYQARLYTLPPSLNQIAGFNYGRIPELGLQPFDAQSVYEIFIRNLSSESTRYEFFSSTYLPSLTDRERNGSRDELYSRFSERLFIHAPAKDTPDRFTIQFQGTDPQQTVSWVKEYADLAKRKAMSEMLENTLSEARVRARGLEQQIETLRESAKDRREDRMVQLKEALHVAKKINLIEPPVITGGSSANENEISAFMSGSLMYMRGAKALEAEIQNLESRPSDDPFILELRSLQEKYSLYTHIKVNPQYVAVMRQDGPTEVPDQPVKPKRNLVIVLGLVLGAMLGLFVALLRIYLANYSKVN
ncbi:LPS O-antigen chain length determinant protein WzzB [Pseudomonas luteola]|uniref:LPS O-antigen chain length determinant protein WzzB n=1 Tax=Pseudomonas luteola TaxID=47886 RepID=UPI00388DFC85